jgi:FkbM family methyltransferase
MGIAVYRTRHGLLCHEELERTIGASLRMYGEWAEEEIYFLSSLIEPGALVLDIGANIGTHALAFSRFVTSRGHVVAIEAQERAYKLLGLNMALNGVAHVNCVRALVGRETSVRFVPPDDGAPRTDLGAISFLEPAPAHDGGCFLTPLPMITLDNLSFERCDLIKIDVEGMELDVLLGAEKTIARHRPPIYFEQTREQRFPETFDLFRAAGYVLFWHVADPFNRLNLHNQAENIFGGTKEINVLGLPREQAERRRPQTSLLQPIVRPVYDPPPRHGSTSGWKLPDTAYNHLPPVTCGSLANSVAETLVRSDRGTLLRYLEVNLRGRSL